MKWRNKTHEKNQVITLILAVSILSNSFASIASTQENRLLSVTSSVPLETTASAPEELSTLTSEVPLDNTNITLEPLTPEIPREFTASSPSSPSSSETEFSPQNIDLSLRERASSKDAMYDIILYSLSDVEKDALKNYTTCYSKSVMLRRTSQYICETYTYSQTELNRYFKSEYNRAIDGSCSLVASTSVAEYYTRKNFARTMGHSSYKPLFGMLTTIGFSTGAYNGAYTDSAKLYKVINNFYNIYSKSGYGKCYTRDLENTIKRYNKNRRPVIGHFVAPNNDAHAMVIAGCYEATVTYKQKKTSTPKKTTIKYYVVNNGWFNATSGNKRLSYVRSDYLKNSITIYR